MVKRPRPQKEAPPPGPNVVVTIRGGPFLTEFTSFSIRPVCRFEPTAPGWRALRGARACTVPTMNRPMTFTLPHVAKALYIHGRSAHDPSHDIHAVLVPEPGAQVVLPLTIASEAKRRAVARCAALLTAAPFVVAWTMPENPHEYTKRDDWDRDADFTWAVRASRTYGHREGYIPPGETEIAYYSTVFHAGTHFCWSFWERPEDVRLINRKPLPAFGIETVSDQTLTVDGARLLAIPPLPRDFAGLDASVTQDKHFQTGVALWGWPVPDPRPRLRARKATVQR